MAFLHDSLIGVYASEGMIEPFDPARVQPASYDMVLAGPTVKVAKDMYQTGSHVHYDIMKRTWHSGGVQVDAEFAFQAYQLPYLLRPGQFAIASTLERVKLPNDVMGRVEGKSTLGRIGLSIHVTAGYIDPGFCGQITLELKNETQWSILLTEGCPIAQVSFAFMTGPVLRPYGSCGNHYQNQVGPTLAKE